MTTDKADIAGIAGKRGRMREIKFRLYTTMTPKKMYQWDEIKTFLGFDDFYQPENIWMQYTGLHDKNGKEIYEGDIVRCIYHDFNYDEREYIGAVSYREDNCIFIISDGASTDYEWWNEEKEVIGNIYENPELIEKGYL